MTRDVLQHHLEDQAGDRVEVAGERIAAKAQGFEWNRAAAGKGVDHERRLATVGRSYKGTTGLEIGRLGGVVPIGEVADELEQALAEIRVRWALVTSDMGEQWPCCLLEGSRAVFVAGIWQEQREQHGTARCQRASRPPKVQSGRVAVADGFLACSMAGDFGDREVNLRKALALAQDQIRSSAQATVASAMARASWYSCSAVGTSRG